MLLTTTSVVVDIDCQLEACRGRIPTSFMIAFLSMLIRVGRLTLIVSDTSSWAGVLDRIRRRQTEHKPSALSAF